MGKVPVILCDSHEFWSLLQLTLGYSASEQPAKTKEKSCTLLLPQYCPSSSVVLKVSLCYITWNINSQTDYSTLLVKCLKSNLPGLCLLRLRRRRFHRLHLLLRQGEGSGDGMRPRRGEVHQGVNPVPGEERTKYWTPRHSTTDDDNRSHRLWANSLDIF